MRKIFFIIFSLIPVFLSAQNENTKIEAQPSKESRSVYQGSKYRAFSIHADIFSPVMGIISNRAIRTFEIQTDANFYDKFFPTIEVGFGQIATTLQEGQYYKSSSPFFRIGMNYSLLKNATKDGKPRVIRSYPFLGVRYGIGVFNCDMGNVPIGSSYWGDEKMYQFAKNSIYAGWLEIVGGVRVDIYDGFTMGWSVRLRTAFHSKYKANLWWTPGYGFTSGIQFAFNYTIGYTFRTKEERAKTAFKK